jgi:hypothetical protein
MANQTSVELGQEERRELSRESTAEELRRKLDSRNEELLRLRDLLIRRDAELGVVRGQLAMFEQGSQRLSNAAARIPIPGATRLIQGLIRLLQGSRG